MKQLFNNLYVSGQLQADDFTALAKAGIKVIINNRPDHEEPGQIDHQAAQALAQENDIDYHYLPMANGQPMSETLVSDFKEILDNNQENILAHCRSGMRSSFIWALGQIADGTVTAEQAINAAAGAGISLNAVRTVLESTQN